MPTKTAADKAAEESAELQAANVQRHLEYHPTEVHGEVVLDEDNKITVDAAGGRVYINSGGEQTLDADQVVTLRKLLDAAFLTVG